VISLRILNGLKRGASIPLQEDSLSVGASFENDIVMLDQGIAEQHFDIKPKASTPGDNPSNEFIVRPIEGKITRIDGTIMKESFLLQKNQPFLVGDIWFVLHDKDTAWPEHLPRIQLKTDRVSDKPNNKNFIKEILAMHPVMLAGAFSVACFVFLGFKNVSYATLSDQPNEQLNDELAELRQQFKEKKVASIDHNNNDHNNNPPTTPMGIATANPQLALQKMIEEREISGVEIQESEGKVLLKGDINDQHKDKLVRMLERFRYDNANGPEVVDMTKALALKLPFEIKAVVSGPYGHVRIDGGQKLLLGESLSGYKLTSITDRTLVFTGKNKIEVNW
jgi:type III secretion protein D